MSSPEQRETATTLAENESIGNISFIYFIYIIIIIIIESEKTSSEKVPKERKSSSTKSEHVYLTLILVDSAKSHEFKISPKVSKFLFF